MACRVGIADDAPDVRMLLRAVLEEEGFDVVAEARNGAEAIEACRQHRPDVFLLDLSMPVMDGLEALPEILSDVPGIRVLVLSGFVNEEVRARVVAMGAAACLEKGTDLAALVQHVRNACEAVAEPANAESEHGSGEGSTQPRRVPPERPGPGKPPAVGPSPSGAIADLGPILLHELETPVTLLGRALAATEAALSRGGADDAVAQLEVAGRAHAAIRALVDAFESATAAEAGKLEVRPEPVDLTELVREAVGDLAVLVAEHEVTFDGVDEVQAKADRDRIRQVLANLLGNAAKFSQPGSTIAITVGTVAGMAEVAVRDHGVGVPPEASEVIFDRHFQVGDAPGMGLGLYIARAIVESHGGTLELERPTDGGSRFVVRLPLA